MNELLDSGLLADLEDPEFAHSYLAEMGNMRLASQVRAIRVQRNWTQEDLARASGLSQAKISSIEGGAFESLTLNTLRKLARAFDVHLSAQFNDVGAAILDIAMLDAKRLQVAPRAESLTNMRREMQHAATYARLGNVNTSVQPVAAAVKPNSRVNTFIEICV